MVLFMWLGNLIKTFWGELVRNKIVVLFSTNLHVRAVSSWVKAIAIQGSIKVFLLEQTGVSLEQYAIRPTSV